MKQISFPQLCDHFKKAIALSIDGELQYPESHLSNGTTGDTILDVKLDESTLLEIKSGNFVSCNYKNNIFNILFTNDEEPIHIAIVLLTYQNV